MRFIFAGVLVGIMLTIMFIGLAAPKMEPVVYPAKDETTYAYIINSVGTPVLFCESTGPSLASPSTVTVHCKSGDVWFTVGTPLMVTTHKVVQ